MTKALKKAMQILAQQNTTKQHQDKILEEMDELQDEILTCQEKQYSSSMETLNEIADVLNTIEIYCLSIGIDDISTLDTYRLDQVKKHLIKGEEQ